MADSRPDKDRKAITRGVPVTWAGWSPAVRTAYWVTATLGRTMILLTPEALAGLALGRTRLVYQRFY